MIMEAIWGVDLDWYAVDYIGNIAVFFSGGQGFVPEIENPSDYLETMRIDFYKSFLRNPKKNCGSVNFRDFSDKKHRKKDPYICSFNEFFYRGIYVYDYVNSSSVASGYYCLFTPKDPIKLSEVAHEKIALVNRSLFSLCVFGRDFYNSEGNFALD